MASPPAPDRPQQDVYQQAWQPREYLRQYYATDAVAEDEQINATLLSQRLRADAHPRGAGLAVGGTGL
jgi:hypothetical protein